MNSNNNVRLALVVSPLSNVCIGLAEMPLAAFVLLRTHSNYEVRYLTPLLP